MHRRCTVDCTWSPELAYVAGLFASDGNLSSDGRHLNITSKEREVVETVRTLLHLENKIGTKARGGSQRKEYFVLQFGDKNFYEFLLGIGLTPAKSKTIGYIAIPELYFPDFFRGCIDGDGSIDSFMHPESRLPQIRLRLCSASQIFIEYMLEQARKCFNVAGGSIYANKKTGMQILSFGKRDALKIFKSMYYADTVPALSRKRNAALTYMGE